MSARGFLLLMGIERPVSSAVFFLYSVGGRVVGYSIMHNHFTSPLFYGTFASIPDGGLRSACIRVLYKLAAI